MAFSMTDLAVLAIVFFSMLIKSVFGFGDALLAMPLLAMAVGIKTATPLFAMIGETMTLIILILRWQHVIFKSARRLVFSSLFGIPIGLFFLKGNYDNLITLFLAVTIILFSVYNLIGPALPRLKNEKYAFLFGFVSGILGGAYNTSGPPIIIYSSLRRWPPKSVIATLQGYFLPMGVFIFIGHGLAGLWTRTVVTYYILCMPFALIALAVGNRLNRTIPSEKFEKWIFGLLTLIGFFLLSQSI